MTEQSALVVALLGDSVVDIRQCDDTPYRIGVELPIEGAEPQTLVEPARRGGVIIHTARYRHGNVTVFVTPSERSQPLARGFDFDARWVGYLGVSLAVHLVLWAFLSVIPPDDLGIGVDLAAPTPLTSAVVAVEAPTGVDNGALDDDLTGVDDDDDEGPGLDLEDKVLYRLGAELAEERPDDRPLSRAQAIENARAAGVLGSLSRDTFSGVVSTGDPASGFDGSAVYGAAGHGQGEFGTERGSTGWGNHTSIASGRYETHGTGPGAGSGWGLVMGRNAHVPMVVMCGRPGCAVAIGDQDKAIIRRYLRRHLSQIQYCYEKELLARPGLAGDITTEFLIAPTGEVTSSHADGFDDAVASCVAGVLANIQFPRAPHGGNTQVHYPFSFHSTE